MNFEILLVLASLKARHKRAVRAHHWNSARFARAEFHAIKTRARSVR